MSLMGTLAKIAIGMAVQKGLGSVLAGGGARNSAPQSGGGLGDLLGGMLGGQQPQSGQRGPAGGIGNILEQLAGGAGAGRGSQSGGGLGDLLGGLAGGQTRGRGGDQLGDIFGEMLSQRQAPDTADSSFGDMFNDALTRQGEPEITPSADQEAAAALMLRAMIQAAKSDGKFDAGEQQKLMENLGDVSPEEQTFVQSELQAPMDVDGLINQVPNGLENQVYLMSVMGINLDNQNEARYLDELARGLDISPDNVNAIHDQLGAPRLYS